MVAPKNRGKKIKKSQKAVSSLFEKRPRSFRVGGHVLPKRDLTRFVRWPKYILLQRQKRILMTRIKVPGLIAQFGRTLDRDKQKELFNILKKYSPEDAKTKRQRLTALAAQKKDGKTAESAKPFVLKFGLNHVTRLVEERRAKLVVIASNVEPIELVLWLPQLCKKFEVPYCFVKGKANLGVLVHQKNATCVALTDVRKEDASSIDSFSKTVKAYYNDGDLRSIIGGGVLGFKSALKQKAIADEKERQQVRKAKGL